MSTEKHADFTEFSRLVDGRLGSEEFEQAQQRLLADDEYRRRYVQFMDMDMDFELDQRLGQALPVPDLAVPEPSPEPVASPISSSLRGRAGSGLGPILLKLAAVIVIGLGVWWLATGYNSESGETEMTSTPPHEEAKRPVEEKIVIDPSPDLKIKKPKEVVHSTDPDQESSLETPPIKPDSTIFVTKDKNFPDVDTSTILGQVWSVDGSSGEWERGTRLTAGEYKVLRGMIEIRLGPESDAEKRGAFKSSTVSEAFDPNVRLIVEGPAWFVVHSADRVELLSGKLSAEVFPRGKGFTVTANSVEVVDLGTRFAVSANTKGDIAFHVYDGLVTGQVAETEGNPHTVRSGETVRLDVDAGRLKPIAFQPPLFAPRPAWKGGIEQYGDMILLRDRPPRAVDRPTLFPGNEAVIFREKSGVVLRDGLDVNLSEPGEVAQGEIRGTIPAGTKISSYLIHFDSDNPKATVQTTVQTTVRFDSPILGVICGDEELHETDHSLGASSTDYPTSSIFRGIEGNDNVRLFDDRRTLSIEFNATKYDQVRIIVAQDP